MKKLVSLICAAIICAAVFAGCGGSKEADLKSVLSTINSENSLSLQALESTDDLSKYYSISADDVKQFAAEIDSNNNAPVEIVLVEANDADAATRVEASLSQRYNSIISQYASYTPDKLDMVKACKVTKDGNYVSLIVAENADKMLETFNSNIK